jgi:cysteine desulfurase
MSQPHIIYMDNHATTRVDPRVVHVMLPMLDTCYGNAGSTSHAYGWEARDAVQRSRESIASAIGASPREIVFTSGATESNNLALRGFAERAGRKGRHMISVETEHRAVLDPLKRLARSDYRITFLPVAQRGRPDAGRIDLDRLADAISQDTILVSVMLANNEIGVLQPLAQIGSLCKQRGIALHCDATQAVGKMPVDVDELQVDLMSFSAHKIYGPKGVGALYVRRRAPNIRLTAQIDGGGQEGGLRSGTLNSPGIVGFAKAIQLCQEEMGEETHRLTVLRNRLFAELSAAVPGLELNGPALDKPDLRLSGNLNVSFHDVDGEALMLSMRQLAVSSGSACTSAEPEPSHVLRALGLSDDMVRSSIRFGLGRFNTDADVAQAVKAIADAVERLRGLSSLA